MRGYVDAFRILGRAKACRLDFRWLRLCGARSREGTGRRARRFAVADLGFAAGAENQRLARIWTRCLPAPMPCDWSSI